MSNPSAQSLVSAPRRILMFIDGLGSGGAQRQFTLLARGLAERGHVVTIAVYNDQDHFADVVKSAGIKIFRLPKPSRWSLKPIIGIGRLYRKVNAEVLIAFLRSPAAKAELAALFWKDMRVVAAERSVYPDGALPLSLRLVENLHRRACYITTNSNHQRLRMQSQFPSFANRVATIQNAVPIPFKRARIRPSIGKAPRLLALSSLMPTKNSVLLARAVASLRSDYAILAQVSWLGETFDHLEGYGAYRQTCAVIDELGLAEQWTWRGTTKDVSREILEYDALIHASSVEGTSNAVCEAMAAGLPVIAGRIADHATLIGGPGAGLLFDSFDPDSIAAAIAKFSRLDEFTRRKMGEVGRELIAREFSEARMVSEYESLVEAAIIGTSQPLAEIH